MNTKVIIGFMDNKPINNNKLKEYEAKYLV